jgi:hypothetical protein
MVKDNKIILLKLYYLQCKKCLKKGEFKKKNILNKFLEERILQKLIYRHYKDEFNKYNNNNDYNKKELKGHEPNLCEKCSLSPTGYC